MRLMEDVEDDAKRGRKMSSRSDVLSPIGRPQLPSRSGLLKPLAITTPMVFLGEMTIAPRLVLQAIRLVGVDRGRISVPFTTRWRRFASLPALLLQPRTVIARKDRGVNRSTGTSGCM
jgi:hypothetical protein